MSDAHARYERGMAVRREVLETATSSRQLP
jgi:hypothetical protein